MSIPVTCAQCGFKTKVKNEAGGKKGKCPSCGAVIAIPLAEPPVVEAVVVEPEAPPPKLAIPLELSSSGPIPLAGGDPDAEAHRRKPCPTCGEMIPIAAMKCRYCGEIFNPELKKREERARRPGFVGGDGDSLSAGEWVVAVLCSGIGCIVGIIWICMGKPKGKKLLLASFCFGLMWGLLRVALELMSQTL